MTVSTVRQSEEGEIVTVMWFTVAGEMVRRILRAEMLDKPVRV